MPRLFSEDEPMLRGTAAFIADLPTPDRTLHAVFVRSQAAHGENLTVDTAAALATPGVVAVLTNADLVAEPISFYPQTTLDGLMARPLLAQDRVRFVGEPVAVVLAESVNAAADAAEQVVVEVDPLAAVADAAAATEDDAPLLFPAAGSNVVIGVPDVPGTTAGTGDPADPCEGADFVADLVCENPRVASAPIEPCGILASYRATAAADTAAPHHPLDIWCTGQGVQIQPVFADSLNLSVDQIRIRHPYVGGGFGGRGDPLVEFLVVAHCARLLERPIRWVQTRTEQFFSLPYGRDQRHHIRLGITTDGDIVGLDATMWLSAGAYPHMGPLLAAASRRQCTGMYRVPRFRYRYGAAVTNNPPVGAYRGAGQPEVNAALERAIDAAARLADLDPNLVRRRNLLKPDDFPYETRLGITIDSGDPIAALDQALAAIDAEHWQTQQRKAQQHKAQKSADRRLIGIGTACYSQSAGTGDDGDYARLELGSDGSFSISCASAGHGQGHHTTWARLASAALGISPEDVSFAEDMSFTDADTDAAPVGLTTGGSRSTHVLGSQISAAAQQLKTQLVSVAAGLLEASPDDITLGAQGAHVVGVPASTVSWADIAAGGELSGELSAQSTDRLGGPTHPYGTHAAVVEVDVDTGGIALLAYAAVDDCGVVLEHESVIGQQHGGSAAGISQALHECAIYDSDATPLTTTFADYLLVSASSLPFFETRQLQIPTERNPLGAKGIGENGAIAAPPAVQNAVVDALAHLGVTHVDIPLSPQRVWQAAASQAVRNIGKV